MHPFLARSLVLVASVLPTLVLGCGASYERLYEGDVRFEHCYRLDVESNAPVNQRRSCWATWARYHTEGQPRNRVEYALARERALIAGDARAVGPNLSVAAASSSVQVPLLPATGAVACPIPNTPFEAPPPTLPKAKAMNGPSTPVAPVAASASASPPLTPHQECVRDCGETFTRCATACTQDRCVARCGERVKKCISDCL